MVIDSHQHFLFPSRIRYPWMQGEVLAPLRQDFGPDDLRPLLRANGVDKTILVQTRGSLEETYEFLQIAADTGYVAGVVGWVDLTDPQIATVLDELMASPNGRYLVGIRHQVHDEPDPNWLMLEAVQKGISELGQRGLVYDFLTKVRELPACLQTARRQPNTRFVIDHIAKPHIASEQWADWLEALTPFCSLPNVWIKLSGMVTEADWQTWQPQQIQRYTGKVIELFGPKRCLFGSDWPVCLLAADYSQVRQALGELPEEVWGKNALEVYKRLVV